MTSLQDDTRDRQQQPQRSSTLEPGNSPSPLPPAHLPDVAPAEGSGNARSGRDPFSRGHPVSFRSPAGPSQGLSLGGSPNSREHMLPGGGGGLDDDSRSMERHTSRTSRASPPRPIFVPHAGDGSNAGHGIEAREPAVRVVDPEREEWAPKTIGARLKSTLDAAIKDRDKFKTSAQRSSLLLNGAIGLQVVVGAVTTGLAAGGSTGKSVAALGAISTVIATYLAKMRGSGEPELSILKGKELDSYLRELEAFMGDHGHMTGTRYDSKIREFRERFELIIQTTGKEVLGGASGLSNGRFRHDPDPPASESPTTPTARSGGGGYQMNEKQQYRKSANLGVDDMA